MGHSLDDSVLVYVGQLLDVEPFYGWGWCGNRAAPEAPLPFSMRLEQFYEEEVERRRGLGRVEAPSHEFDGRWVSFAIRHSGTFNFTTRPGDFNVVITRQPALMATLQPYQDPGAALGYAGIRAR